VRQYVISTISGDLLWTPRHNCSSIETPSTRCSLSETINPAALPNRFAAIDNLILTLNLMVSSHDLTITRRRARLITSRAHTRSLHILTCGWSILRLLSRPAAIGLWFWYRRSRVPLLSLSLLRPISPSTPTLLMSDIIIRHRLIPTCPLSFTVRNDFVIIVALGIFGNDVPCVQEAGQIPQHAEEDV
jgi:hypothetical protein